MRRGGLWAPFFKFEKHHYGSPASFFLENELESLLWKLIVELLSLATIPASTMVSHGS